MHVLLVEDDLRLGEHIQKALQEQGHIVDHRTDGREGLLSASAEQYDAIILDRTLPRVDGLKILQTLRAVGDQTPVLILSALGTVEDKVAGLKAGSDDYVSKPFAISELMARLEAMTRRGPSEHRPTRLTVGDLVLDISAHTIHKGGKPLDLTGREFRVLEYLMRNADHVVTRSMILESVWEYNFDPQTNVIDQYIRRIRQKIDSDCSRTMIHTIRGSGYCIRSNT